MSECTDPIRRVAAVVPTYQRPHLLRRTLESLGASDDPGVPFEIVVVENGPTPAALEAFHRAESAYPLRYLHVKEPGKAMALNLAFELIDAPFVVQYDDDVRVAPGSVAAYVAAARRYGAGHFFGGPLTAEYEEPPPRWLRPHLPPSARGRSLGATEREIDLPDFAGANWAAFRADVQSLGGFADALGPQGQAPAVGGEETDLQRRMLAAGLHAIYLPDAMVWHFVPRERCSLKWTLDRLTREFQARARYWDHPGDGPALAGVPLWLVKQLLLSGSRVLAARMAGTSWPDRIDREVQFREDVGRLRGYRQRARYRVEATA